MKFNIPQKYRLSVLVYNKKFTVILSVVLAFTLWLGIAITENPVRDQTFNNLSANVSLENTAASGLGLGIISDVASQKFSITVSGPNYIVSSLKSTDFTLSASTVDINTAGTFTLNVNANSNNTKSGYTITSITPSTIDVTVDFIDTKEFDITPKLIDVRASTGLIADQPIVADSQHSKITINGPRSVLEKINSVAAVAEVGRELQVTENFNANVILYDSNNTILYRYSADGTVYDSKDNIITNSYLTLSFTNIKVTQPILKKKTVDIKAEFSNMPSGISADNLNFTLAQNKVTILGTPEVVDKLDAISLAPIDFKNISVDNNTFKVDLQLPTGVTLIENGTNAKIEKLEPIDLKIDLSNFEETVVNIKNIKCINTNLKTKTDKNLRIKICGPKSTIKNINSSKISLIVDLTDKTAGDYNVEATIKSDDYKDIWQVGTVNVSVNLY